METTIINIKPSWLRFFALFFFFFMQFFLIDGMMTVWMFTPVWMFSLYKWDIHYNKTTIVYFSFFLFYAVIHLLQGAAIGYYFLSSVLIFCTVIFIYFFYYLLKLRQVVEEWDTIMKQIVLVNFLLTICAIPLLWIPALKNTVWYVMSISANIKPIPRLKMFTSEASHYSFLWALPFIYFYTHTLLSKTSKYGLTLFMVSIPLLLSFSLGVLIALAVAGLCTLFLFREKMLISKQTKQYVWYVLIALTLIILIVFLIFPENPLFLRIQNVFSGKDTSARGRTYEAFILAHKIIQGKSLLWGIGPGQLKVFGRQIIIQYYFYSSIPDVVRIPNACADTIVCFGYVGLILRLSAEIFLFLKTRVAQNPFRLWLFLFLFIYQFTGSYITNIAEYILWTIAFSPLLLREMNIRSHQPGITNT